jgi:hypothetical protein
VARESLLTWIGQLSSTNTTAAWMGREVAAALGRTGMHNQFMRDMIKIGTGFLAALTHDCPID